jgi:glycosyltransferase involved in cell wall biosynthesis
VNASPQIVASNGATRATRGRLLVVSHPCVVAVNQTVYSRLRDFGWEPMIIVPDRWRHEYAPGTIRPRRLAELERNIVEMRVLLPGRPQRHVYIRPPTRMLRDFRPRVAFLEEESFSIPAFQWGRALARAGVPFGVQAAENLERPLPWLARRIRAATLGRAAFVAARSPAAGDLARKWGATGEVRLVPHCVPEWSEVPRSVNGRAFTVGFAGRLTEEKGVEDLVRAVGLIAPPVRLLLVGDGPLREAVNGHALKHAEVDVWTGFEHERMPEAYAEMDVLVLPSRTTTRWMEQFGRVIVEALWCGTPVVGSDSGEIPWVIQSTGGGRIFPEGDAGSLARVLTELRDRPEERDSLARQGREAVERMFSLDAAAAALDAALLSASPTSLGGATNDE